MLCDKLVLNFCYILFALICLHIIPLICLAFPTNLFPVDFVLSDCMEQSASCEANMYSNIFLHFMEPEGS